MRIARAREKLPRLFYRRDLRAELFALFFLSNILFLSSNNICVRARTIYPAGIRRVDAVDKSACRANRDHTTRKPIRVAAARAVRANVRLDAIEIPRETSSFPLFLSLSLSV